MIAKGEAMGQDFEPFYDVNLSYDDNYARGPFGAFAEALAGAADASGSAAVGAAATTEFLGHRVNLPFGIPARGHGGAIRSRTCWPCTRKARMAR